MGDKGIPFYFLEPAGLIHTLGWGEKSVGPGQYPGFLKSFLAKDSQHFFNLLFPEGFAAKSGQDAIMPYDSAVGVLARIPGSKTGNFAATASNKSTSSDGVRLVEYLLVEFPPFLIPGEPAGRVIEEIGAITLGEEFQ